MNNIDFYFSIGSTYTYLSVTRALEAEKQHQIKFNWTPFSVRAIMKEMNNVPFPKEKKNKVDYMWRDIERRAKNYGFFAKTPVPYPLTEFDLANKISPEKFIEILNEVCDEYFLLTIHSLLHSRKFSFILLIYFSQLMEGK